MNLVKKTNNHPNSIAFQLDANSELEKKVNFKADIVISMLPARMHYSVLKDCVEFGIHVITPSYITKEIRLLNEGALKKNVLVLNELGLSPGIDHMTAKKMIDEVKKIGELIGFESFTEVSRSPENDNNPWNYKFTWNQEMLF